MPFTLTNMRTILIQSLVLTVIMVCGAMVYLKYDVLRRVPATFNECVINRYHTRDEVEPIRPYLIPSDQILKELSDTELMEIYWRYVNTMQILCRNQTRFGSLGDGGKEACFDGNFKLKKHCIVYSFGSQFRFDFEMAVYNSYGCAVYSFDPSMNIKGTRNKKIPKEITFKEVGLSGKNYVTSKNWQMKTLETILKENGHQNKTVDILKVDIEGDEWPMIANILESGAYKQVKQLLVELHFGYVKSKPQNGYWGGMSMAKQLRCMRMLYEYGFRVFMRERVHANFWKMQAPPYRQIAPQNELCFINTAFQRH